MLMERRVVGDGLPAGSAAKLRAIVERFSTEQAAEIKATEKVTNHDVKAVECFIKARFDDMGLGKLKEWVHFFLTSQDINNTSVPLLLKDGLEKSYIRTLSPYYRN